MNAPLEIRPADYPQPHPHPRLSLRHDDEGMVRGSKEFVARNTGQQPVTVTFDVVVPNIFVETAKGGLAEGELFIPEVFEGWPPADSFVADQRQVNLPAGEAHTLLMDVALPAPKMPPLYTDMYRPRFMPHSFQARVRSPGLPPALSVPVECWPPLPRGLRLASHPEGGFDLNYGPSDTSRRPHVIVFTFEPTGAADEMGSYLPEYAFDVGAPDSESAAWFEAAETAPRRWEVTMDDEALRGSRRSSVLLKPTLSFTEIAAHTILFGHSPPPPEPFAQWEPYPVWW